MTLTDLLSRCREAKEGSRELDAAITIALGDGPDEGWVLQTHQPVVHNMSAGTWIKGNRIRSPKPYTSSVDAILSLIEAKLPEWDWQVRKTGYAELHHPTHHLKDEVGRAATPALALCCAFLQALIALEPK